MSENKLDYERGLQQGKFEKEMELAPERINLRNENLKLRNNWHELKKWLEEKDNNGYEKVYVEDLLYKMQELEQGKDE